VRAAIYLRVSTNDQRLDSQREDTLNAARARGYEYEIFEDHASGAKTSRTALDAMMAAIRKGRFQAVVAWKLDRLGRSLPHLAQLIGELDRYQIGLLVPGQGIDTTENNPAARLQLHVLMAIAEFERSMISERTKAGLQAARRRGKALGRPKGAKSIPDRRWKLAERILADTPQLSCPKLARATGISVGTAHSWKKQILQNSSQ